METITERVHRFCHDLRSKQAISRLRVEMALRAAPNGDPAKVTRQLTAALIAIDDERALVDERQAEVAGGGAGGEGQGLTTERLQAIEVHRAALERVAKAARAVTDEALPLADEWVVSDKTLVALVDALAALDGPATSEEG